MRVGACLAYALKHGPLCKVREWTPPGARGSVDMRLRRGARQPQRIRRRHRTAPPTALTGNQAERYALLWENSFSTGTPTLCRAREAQSRWKNSST